MGRGVAPATESHQVKIDPFRRVEGNRGEQWLGKEAAGGTLECIFPAVCSAAGRLRRNSKSKRELEESCADSCRD